MKLDLGLIERVKSLITRKRNENYPKSDVWRVRMEDQEKER